MHNETPKTTSEKILERIKAGNVAPRSRLFFSAKNAGLWTLAGLSVLVGALAVSSILFRVINIPRVLPPGLPPPPFATFLYLVPFLWIVLFGTFSYLAYREVRSTKRGYRYELRALLLMLLILTGGLGYAFYRTGTGIVLDRFAAKHVPFQRDLEGLQRERWQSPERGFLVGELTASTPSGIVLLDARQTRWDVTFAESIPREKKDRLSSGERVGVRGEVVDSELHIFLACDVRSLEFEGRPAGETLLLPPKMLGSERKVLIMRSNECEDVRTPD
jgi:hypothetical protein